DRTRLDTDLVEVTHYLVAIDHKTFAQDNRIHPVCMIGPSFSCRQQKAIGIARQSPIVSLGNQFAFCQMKIDTLELRKTYCSSYIRHAIIVANNRKPISLLRIHSLTAKQAKPRSQFSVISRHHTSFAGGDDLVSKEAKRRSSTMPPEAPAL